jgi:hypothetical protein
MTRSQRGVASLLGKSDVTRVRFEIRILGVAKVQTFHYNDEIPDPLPAVGDYATHPRSLPSTKTRRSN